MTPLTAIEISRGIPEPPPRSAYRHRAAMSFLAAGVALVISTVVPLLGPLLISMLLGVVAANTPRTSRHVVGTSPQLDRFLLRAGVVLLGLKIAISDVVALGPAGLTVVVITVATTYGVTQVAGRVLGVDRELTTLVAAGFSICGAAAIAAVESSVRATGRDLALAIAMVTAFGSAMIVAIPGLGHLLGLSDRQTAVWAGASVHEVAQVIAAASLIGPAAAAAAMTVKLARVALLAPVQMLSARICRNDEGRQGPLVPLFLVGFVIAVAVRSTGILPASMLSLASAITTILLSAAMFGLGTSVAARHLWPAPGRALALACVATLTAGGVSLGLVTLMV